MKGFKKAISDDDKEKDSDFVVKENVEDKSINDAGDATNTVQQTKSEQKEHK
jgi:sec-independent protein translocase protein TatA